MLVATVASGLTSGLSKPSCSGHTVLMMMDEWKCKTSAMSACKLITALGSRRVSAKATIWGPGPGQGSKHILLILHILASLVKSEGRWKDVH